MLCDYFEGDSGLQTFKLSKLAAIEPSASVSAADSVAQHSPAGQQLDLIQMQMQSCLLLVTHSLIQPKSPPRLPDSHKDDGTDQAENTNDTRCIFLTSLVVVKAAVLALGVHNQNADNLSARAQL